MILRSSWAHNAESQNSSKYFLHSTLLSAPKPPQEVFYTVPRLMYITVQSRVHHGCITQRSALQPYPASWPAAARRQASQPANTRSIHRNTGSKNRGQQGSKHEWSERKDVVHSYQAAALHTNCRKHGPKEGQRKLLQQPTTPAREQQGSEQKE